MNQETDIFIERSAKPPTTAHVSDAAVNPLRPLSMRDYIGQTHITQALSVFIQAARSRSESLDHVLLFGPPGLGKTTLSRIIAHEMQANIKQTSGPVLDKPGDLAGILSSLEQNDILFIDEIHRLNPQIEEILYPAMEDFKLDIMIGEGPSARSVTLDLPPFTLIGATTRAGNLTAPLRARFGITQRLEFYQENELARIIQRASRILQFDLEEKHALILAKHARGTPRIANKLLRRLRDYSQSKQLTTLEPHHILDALALLGIDRMGFDHMDQKYIHTLLRLFHGGPVGVESLAVSMGESRQTIEDMIEPYLIQTGYIMRTPRGRVASEALKQCIHPDTRCDMHDQEAP